MVLYNVNVVWIARESLTKTYFQRGPEKHTTWHEQLGINWVNRD